MRHAMILLLAAALAAGGQQGGERPGTISGTLIGRNGKPAAGVRVMALSADPAEDGAQSLVSLAATDGSGHFLLESVPPGRYFVVTGKLDVPSYYPGVAAKSATQVVTVKAGQTVTGIDFRAVVAAQVRVRGRVIREDGLPLKSGGAAIALYMHPTVGNGGGYNPKADDDGRFEVQFPSGTYTVGAVGSFRIDPEAMTFTEENVTLELFVPFFVPAVARVTVEGGGPVPRFELQFSRTTGSRFEARIVNTPQFEDKLRPGDYRLKVNGLPPGYALTADGVDLLNRPYQVTPAGAPEIDVRLAAAASPPPWRKVSGKVAGRALADRTQVKVWNDLSAGPLNVTYYLDGSFEMLALPGRTRAIAMSPDTSEFVTTEFTVLSAGNLDDVTIDLPSAPPGPDAASRLKGRIAGKVKASGGARELVLRPEAGAEPREIKAPLYMDGSFELPGIPPGVYVAEIRPHVGGALTARVVVAPGSQEIVIHIDQGH